MLLRSVSLNVLGSFGSLAVGFASSLLLANWLGAADRGLLGILVTASSLALTLLGLGLPTAVAYFASRPEVEGPSLLGGTAAYGALLAVACVPAAWLLERPLADAFAHGRGGHAWILAGVLVPLTFLDWTTHNQLLGRLRFRLYNALAILSKVATLALVVALVGALGLGLVGAVLAVMAASAVMIGGSLPVILRSGRPRVDRRLFRRLVGYGVRVQVGAVLQSINYRLDVLVLGLFAPLAAVGSYFVAEMLAELVITIAGAFHWSVLPLVSHYEGVEQQEQTTIAAIRHQTILALLATGANAVFSPLVIVYALSPGYRSGLLPFFVLLPSMVFAGAGTVACGDLRGRGRPGLSSVCAGVAVVITLVLDFALIPPFGTLGAAVASVCAYTAYGIASVLSLSRVSGIPLSTLVVPTRGDLALYRTVPLQLLRRRASRVPAVPVEDV